jgi:hypothetical protein
MNNLKVILPSEDAHFLTPRRCDMTENKKKDYRERLSSQSHPNHCSKMTLSVVPNRRVIFPVLHEKIEAKDLTQDIAAIHEDNMKAHRKFPSSDSISDLKIQPITLTISPRFRKIESKCNPNNEASPVCVKSFNPKMFLEIPPLSCLPDSGSLDIERNGSHFLIPAFRRCAIQSDIKCNSFHSSSHVTQNNCVLTVRANIVPSILTANSLNCMERKQISSILRNKSLESLLSVSEHSGKSKRVRFDARISVIEFACNANQMKKNWYSPAELESFKLQALKLLSTPSTELLPTGTGRMVRCSVPRSTVLFTHPKFFADETEDEYIVQSLIRHELKRIMVVDPHDLCRSLFTKALRQILPNACISQARTSDEVLNCVKRLGTKCMFDLVLVEERLQLIPTSSTLQRYQYSGSALIVEIKKMVQSRDLQTLFLGVSAHFDADKEQLEQSGASICFPKPPPPIDKTIRDKIMKQILILRGKTETAGKYF